MVARQHQAGQPGGDGHALQAGGASKSGAFLGDYLAPDRGGQLGTAEQRRQLRANRLRQRGLIERGGGVRCTHHHRAQPGMGAIELAAVKHELAPVAAGRVILQRVERQAKAHCGSVLQVASGDRLVGKGRKPRHRVAQRQAGQQGASGRRRHRQHHRVEPGAAGAADRMAGRVDAPAGAIAHQVGNLGAAAHRASALCDEACGRGGEQGMQVAPRQQHVGSGAAGAQAVAQHGKKHFGGGDFGRGVQRRQAQRAPHQLHQARRLVEAGQQFRHAAVDVELPAHPARRTRKSRQRDLVGQSQAFGAQQRDGQVERRRQARGDEIHAAAAVRVAHLQGQVQQRRLGVDADQAQQALGVGVGAKQDVLAIVEHAAAHLDAARAPAQSARRLEQRDAASGLGQLDRRGAAGPAAADDGDLLARRGGHGSRDGQLSHGRRFSTPATACAAA